MTPSGLTVTVVICAYTLERWERLQVAVNSVRAQRLPADRIILVVDHCPELAARAEAHFQGIRVITNTGPRGLSGARNCGVADARGDIVAFLDDDAVADPNWIARILAPYADPNVLGVGGRIEPVWETGRPAWFPHEFDWVVGCSYGGQPTRAQSVRNFIGANMSFRRTEVLDANGFRTDLGRVGNKPVGCEETELCIRITSTSGEGRLMFEPGALVHHHVPAQRATVDYFRARCYAEGISKAGVARHAGIGRALASERAFLRSTLPRAVGRHLRTGHLSAAAAVVFGVLCAAYGYLVGSLPRAVGGTAFRWSAIRANGWVMVCLPTALALWLASLQNVRLGRMGDLGLLDVLPVTYWVALAMLTIGFVLAVRDRRTPTVWFTAYVLTLIVFLHATPTLLYPSLRYAWSWKHVSIIETLIARGGVLPDHADDLAVYSQWPGFFTLNALFLQITGLSSPLGYAAWFPPLVNALVLAPLLVLYRSATRNRRLIWTAAWLFISACWVGQDYFSPQAFAFLLYVTLLAAICHRFPHRRATNTDTVTAAEGNKLLSLLPWLAAPIAAIVVSHQLTPLMLITALAALALARHRRRAVLPLALYTLVIVIVWFLTVARPYLTAHLHELLADVGGDSDGPGVISLSAASRGQIAIAVADRVLTAGVLLLAACGLFFSHRLRHSTIAVLALAPLPLLAISSYGGEMVFRVYLFALPAAALPAALILVRPWKKLRRTRWLRWVVLGATLPALLGCFLFGYYGKETSNYFTRDEVAAGRALYRLAPHGSLIVAVSDTFPAAYTDYVHYQRLWLDQQTPGDKRILQNDPLRGLQTLTRAPERPVFILLSRAQRAESEAVGRLPVSVYDRLAQILSESPATTVIRKGPDSVIYRFTPSAVGSLRTGAS